ncbi:MAG: hypothetical protein IPL61_32885 [Myxococcales bacterium]|nr:hypothetical protein [Myxococcales bacterium]
MHQLGLGGAQLGGALAHLLLEVLLGAPLALEQHLQPALDPYVGGDVAVGLDDHELAAVQLDRRRGDDAGHGLAVAAHGGDLVDAQAPGPVVGLAADARVRAQVELEQLEAPRAGGDALGQHPPAQPGQDLVRRVVVADAPIGVEDDGGVDGALEQGRDLVVQLGQDLELW